MEASPQTSSPTRADVRTWWKDIATGRCTRREASLWAQDHIDRGKGTEELVLQGLLFLQASNLTPDESGRPVHSQEPDAVFYCSAEELGEFLTIWERRLRDYDEDPEAWMRGYYRRMISEFAAWKGIEAARSFGRKLIRAGHMSADVLIEALDNAPPSS